MRIKGSQNSPVSGDANAKWRTEIRTRVSINPIHKHALKPCHEHRHIGAGRYIASDIKQKILIV